MGYKEGPPRFHVRPPLLKKISTTFHVYRRFLIFSFFLLVTVLTIVINYSNSHFASQARGIIYEVTRPVASLANVPYEGLASVRDWSGRWMFAVQKIKTLEAENMALRSAIATYRQMHAEHMELRKLVRVARTHPRYVIAAKVLAYPGRPYVKSILINVGEAEGVKGRQPVIQVEGLVGRTLDVGLHSARVLLMSDLNSKIPIVVRGAQEHAILVGDNSPYPILKYVAVSSKIKVGDRVETSGRGGIFKEGMPVGYVMSVTPTQIKIKPDVPLENLKYVTVLSSEVDPLLHTMN